MIDAQMPGLREREAALELELSTVRGSMAALEKLKKDVAAARGTRTATKKKASAAARAVTAEFNKKAGEAFQAMRAGVDESAVDAELRKKQAPDPAVVLVNATKAT